MSYMSKYRFWLESKETDAELKNELQSIAGDEMQISERFYRELDFGTAGLRGIIGAGTNRMNVHVVERATQGLADYLNKNHASSSGRGVAIAYDSRLKSGEFALRTALVLAGNGIRAYLFKTLHSVPQLSFAVRNLNCIAGVVITASHNPPQYNGYKLYWEHGGQIGPALAEDITAYIRSVEYFEAKTMKREEALSKGLLVMLGEKEDDAYYNAVKRLSLRPALLKSKGNLIKIVYTPLHGTGNIPVRALLKSAGLTDVHVVPEQELPDPSFSTVIAPNPEEKEAFGLAFRLADKTGADIIIATDPDSDRLGVAARNNSGEYTVLTGNQIGCLLTYYILEQKNQSGTLPPDAVVVRSIVTTRMADVICASFGVKLLEVLTGFRYVSDVIAECEKTGELSYLFGFEESYGYLAGTFSRDKDAISTALLVAETALFYKLQGLTLQDAMEWLYQKFGFYMERTKSYSLEGKEGIERIKECMSRLRCEPPRDFAGVDIICADDYLVRRRTIFETGRSEPIMLPSADALMFTLADDSWICIRPSGTEPKLKLYIGSKSGTEEDAEKLTESLLSAADGVLSKLLGR